MDICESINFWNLLKVLENQFRLWMDYEITWLHKWLNLLLPQRVLGLAEKNTIKKDIKIIES